MVYWTDINQDKIQRANIGTHNQSLENVIQYNLESPEGIAVDWIGKKLYWTDRIPGKIEVSELNGRNRAILISENVHRPRAIVVHPKDRYICIHVNQENVLSTLCLYHIIYVFNFCQSLTFS